MSSARVVAGFLLLSAVGAAQQYLISTYAGGGQLPTPVRALEAPLEAASGVATDRAGNLYFANADSILKVDPGGILTRVAGTSRPGYSGDGGPATKALMDRPHGICVGPSGAIYIGDTNNHRVRRVK